MSMKKSQNKAELSAENELKKALITASEEPEAVLSFETENIGGLSDATRLETLVLTPETTRLETISVSEKETVTDAFARFSSEAEADPDSDEEEDDSNDYGNLDEYEYALISKYNNLLKEENPNWFKRRKIKKLQKRRRIYEKSLEKDIFYRGPLSYRHLRIIAWLFVAFLPVAFFMRLAAKVDPNIAKELPTVNDYANTAKNMILPLFLVANFAVILDKKEKYKNLILKYALMTLGIFVGIALIYTHYVKGLFKVISKVSGQPVEDFYKGISKMAGEGHFAFNIFVDLLLCTLFMYFTSYRPKKYFRGNKIIIFRCFALLPIAYEVFCIALKILVFEGKVQVPLPVFPLMTTKPPMMIFFFVMMVLNMKNRERRFLSTGLSYEQYKRYEKTKRSSLHFSLHACAISFVCLILDGITFFVIAMIMILNASNGDLGSFNTDNIETYKVVLERWGFLKSVNLISMIPIFLLFSYSRSYKNKFVDSAVPLAGIALIIYIIIEGIYRVITLYMERGMDLLIQQVGDMI